MAHKLRIAIIGAGMAGLTCARKLAQAGFAVSIFDKARGPGGRLSSRRRDGLTFDLGAQSFDATSAPFKQACRSWVDSGWLGAWPQPGHWVGKPRMSALTRQLATDLNLYVGQRIIRLDRVGDAWQLVTGSGQAFGPFDQVLLATPAAQALPLIEPHSTLAQACLKAVEVDPLWVAYWVLAEPLAVEARRSASQNLRRCECLNHKPEQNTTAQRWVVEATTDWSWSHLETPADQVAELLFAQWQAQFGAAGAQSQPVLLEAHRWLYGVTRHPVGQPCFYDHSLGLGLCGDYWCGSRVEDAWHSGDALGDRLLSELK